MYNSQYYTCEQIDERLLQGYLDDYNTQTGQSLTKAQFLTKLGSIFSKEGVIDNTATQIGYYECDTAAGTAAKTITVANYALFAGGSMKVKFANKNTANNATLNINSQGAKALYYQGERASATNSWDANEVVEIYYDGTSYYANNVKGGSGSGVYDVSKEHPTSGPNSDGKFTLEYILNSSNVNELIPVNKRYPGMSIQFVSTSDNKYVQFRYMSSSTAAADFTNVANWQGVDDEIVAGSKNIADSNAMHKELYDESTVAITFGPSTNKIDTSYVSQNGDIIGEANSYRIYYFACNKGDKFTITLNASSVTTSARLFAVYSGDTSANFSSETAIEVSEAKLSDNGTYIVRILDDRAKYIAIGTLLSQPNAVSVAKAVYISKFDTIEEDMINSKSWTHNGNVVYDSNEIPMSCNIKWADGTEGTLSYSNFNSDVFEYTTLTATYKDKTIVYTLTYDSNGYIINETINIQ